MARTPLFRTPDATLYTNHDIVNGREGKFTRISKEELRDLVLKAQQGDMKAKDAVCREVYRFVLKRVSSFKRRGVEKVEPDDLFQAGMRGVLTAIEKFEYDRGFSFLTYLTAWVDQAIDREFQNTFCEMRIPNHVWGSYRQLTSAYREIVGERAELDDDYAITVPKDVLIDRALATAKGEEKKSISRDTLESAYTYLLRGGHGVFTSMDQPYGRDEEGDGENTKTLGNTLEDENYSAESMEDELMMDETIRNVRLYLRYIDRRSRYVLMRRFGLGNNFDGLTLEEVGNELGVTRERIRQIEANAIRALKRLMTVCRTMDPVQLDFNMKAMYGRRPPKPFTLPESILLTDEEEEIMSHDLFGEMKPYKAPAGRVKMEGKRYKGRIVPDWFDHSQIRAMGVRKQLQDHEMNPHELLVRYKLYGKRELTQDQVLENV